MAQYFPLPFPSNVFHRAVGLRRAGGDAGSDGEAVQELLGLHEADRQARVEAHGEAVALHRVPGVLRPKDHHLENSAQASH